MARRTQRIKKALYPGNWRGDSRGLSECRQHDGAFDYFTHAYNEGKFEHCVRCRAEAVKIADAVGAWPDLACVGEWNKAHAEKVEAIRREAKRREEVGSEKEMAYPYDPYADEILAQMERDQQFFRHLSRRMNADKDGAYEVSVGRV